MPFVPQSDLEPFIQAIYQDPGESGHRLILADFLDESDDPRGTALRVTAHLAQVPEPSDDPSTYQTALRGSDRLLPWRRHPRDRQAYLVFPPLLIKQAFPGGMPHRGAHLWGRLIAIAAARLVITSDRSRSIATRQSLLPYGHKDIDVLAKLELQACGLVPKSPEQLWLIDAFRLCPSGLLWALEAAHRGRRGAFIRAMDGLITGLYQGWNDHQRFLQVRMRLHFQDMLKAFATLDLTEAISRLYQAQTALGKLRYTTVQEVLMRARAIFDQRVHARAQEQKLSGDPVTRLNLLYMVSALGWPSPKDPQLALTNTITWADGGFYTVRRAIEKAVVDPRYMAYGVIPIDGLQRMHFTYDPRTRKITNLSVSLDR